MTTHKTTTHENARCNVYRSTTYALFGTPYLSLHTADPTEAGSFAAEVSGGSYARQDCEFGTPSEGVLRNNSFKIFFPIATGTWGTITHVGINNHVSATAATTMLYFGAMAASKVVNTDDQLIFNLSVTET